MQSVLQFIINVFNGVKVRALCRPFELECFFYVFEHIVQTICFDH